MRRSLAFMFLAGPALALVWVALAHAGTAKHFGIVAVCLAAWAWGGLLLALPARNTPDVLLQGTLVVGTVLISLTVYFSGDSGAGFGLFYLWTTPYAYVFFSTRYAALHTAWVGLCFGVVLALEQPSDGPVGEQAGGWLIVVGTVVIVGVLVRRLANWLRESDARFRRGFDDSSVGMTLVGTDLRFLEVNDAMCEMLGRSREQLIGAHVNAVTSADDLDVAPDAALAAISGAGARQIVEKRLVRPDGSWILASINTSLVRDAAGRPMYFFNQVEDITARRHNEEELARRARQQEAVARLGQVAVGERDLHGLMNEVVATVSATLEVDLCNVLELTADGERLRLVAGTGWKRDLVIGTHMSAHAMSHAGYTVAAEHPVVVADFATETRFKRSPLLAEHGVVSGLSVVVEGRDRPFGLLGAHSTRARAFTLDDVNFVQAVANVLSTALERRRQEEANHHAALHDALTGLPNRTLLLDRIDHALSRRRNERTTVAVLVLDLDRFKVINDSLGHARGDELLLALAPRLRDAVDGDDTVGRLGADEFVVVCESLDGPADAHAVAQRVSRAIREPVALASGEHVVTASIGIAVATDAEATAEALLRDADAAMHRAKRRGHGHHELFDENMREEVVQRLRMESELRRALEHDQLRVHYQPIVDPSSGRPVSVEALVRWEHPERGMVPPGDFIPVAEETGLITDIGLWVLTEACRQVATWQRELAIPLQLCVNVSVRQIANPAFPAHVADIVRRSGLQQGTLGLEITESVLIEEAKSPVDVLSTLRQQGLRLILDDFGTGYSSLSYLKRFELDALKVDRSFIRGLGADADDSAIVEAIIQMAQTLGLDVVAEGVETENQLEELRRLRCPRVQGYFFARPLPAHALTPILTEQLVPQRQPTTASVHGG